MFKDLNDIRLFAEVVRRGAVTRGAAALGMPAATVSRRLAAVEREIGVRLIERSARHFELTDTGKAYHAAASRLMEDLESVTAEVSGLVGRPAGPLHIAAPPDFATFFMADAVASFCSAYPDVELSMDLSPRRVDLIDEGFDVAVRMGELKDSRLVSRRLATLQRGLYASRKFAATNELPPNPQSLPRCCLVTLDAYSAYGDIVLLRSDRPSIKRSVSVEGHIRVNSMAMLRQLLLAGAGIGLVPHKLMEAELKASRVVRVLPDWQAPAVEAHLLYRTRALLPQRVRLFVDHLVKALESG